MVYILVYGGWGANLRPFAQLRKLISKWMVRHGRKFRCTARDFFQQTDFLWSDYKSQQCKHNSAINAVLYETKLVVFAQQQSLTLVHRVLETKEKSCLHIRANK